MHQRVSILMFSMSPYTEWVIDKKANRNFHILRALCNDARVDKVISVDFLPHTFRRAVRQRLELRRLRGIGTPMYGGLTNSCRRIDEKLYVYSTIDAVLSTGRFHSGIRKLLECVAIRTPLVIWSYTPLFTEYYESTKADVLVFDAVDNWAEHPSYGSFRNRILSNYQKISSLADVVFTVTQHLAETLFKASRHAEWIPNGVDVDQYSQKLLEPDDLYSIPHPRIGYVGVIQRRVDFTLVRQLADAFPRAHFVFVGPVWPDADIKFVKGLSHVHFLGPKPYDSLPAYLQHMDVGIIPHASGEFVKSMNPMKLYEYLAAGIPVVTTPVSGTELFPGLLHTADNPADFERAITLAMNEKSESQATHRRDAVAPHSWTSRADTMLRRIVQQI